MVTESSADPGDTAVWLSSGPCRLLCLVRGTGMHMKYELNSAGLGRLPDKAERTDPRCFRKHVNFLTRKKWEEIKEGNPTSEELVK